MAKQSIPIALKEIPNTPSPIDPIDQIELETPVSKPAQVAQTFKSIKKTDADKQAEDLRDKRKLPPSPGNNVSHDVMVKWLGLLSKEQWERITVYCYRHWPEIDRKQSDPTLDLYIDVFSTPPTLQYMIETHGGGRYGFRVNDTDKPGSLFESFLEIPYPEYLPKYNLVETVWTSRKNVGWVNRLRADGKIDVNNKPVAARSENPTSVAGNDTLAIVDRIASIYRDNAQESRRKPAEESGITSAISQIIIENMKQNDPTKLLAMVQAMIPKPTPTPVVDNGMSTMLPMIMKMMEIQQTNAQNQMTMLMEVMKQNNNSGNSSKGGGDMIGTAERLIAFADQLAKRHAPTGETSTADKIIEATERIGLPLAEVVMNALMARNAASSGGTYVPPPAKHLLGSGGVTVVEGQPINNPSMPSPIATGANPELVELFTRFGPMLVNVINSGMGGADYGNTLEAQIGTVATTQIISAGTEQLTLAIKSVPSVWNAIVKSPEDENRMLEWIDDFVHYREATMEDR